MYGEKNPFNNQLSNDELNALKAEDLVDFLHGLLHTNIWLFIMVACIERCGFCYQQSTFNTLRLVAYPKEMNLQKCSKARIRFVTDYDMVKLKFPGLEILRVMILRMKRWWKYSMNIMEADGFCCFSNASANPKPWLFHVCIFTRNFKKQDRYSMIGYSVASRQNERSDSRNE